MRHRIMLFLILFLIPSVKAQIILNPGELELTIETIIVTPDKTTGKPLKLYGDTNYLNIFWNATYYSGEVRDIGVKCYLNCPDPGDDIDRNCTNYGSQLCDPPTGYLGPTGRSSCTIVKPRYLFKEINNVACKFYDPLFPEVSYTFCPPKMCYPNITFKAIDFEAYVSGPISTTVGKPFELPIIIKNLGLLNSSYTVNISALVNPQFAQIDRQTTTTEQLSYGQIGAVYPNIIFLSSGGLTFKILTKSNIEPVDNFDTSCNNNADCHHYGLDAECLQNRCWKRFDVAVSAGISSLPEFDIYGVIQILLLATLALVFIKL